MKSFDKDIFKLVCRDNPENYSPNNVKSISISPKRIICNYFIDDRGGKRVDINTTTYAEYSCEKDYKSFFQSFTETVSADGTQKENHMCQNLEEITINFTEAKASTDGSTNYVYLSPKDINILDIFVGNRERGRITTGELNSAKNKYKTEILDKFDSSVESIKQQKGKSVKPSAILAYFTQYMPKIATSFYSNPEVKNVISKGLPRLRKITLVYQGVSRVVYQRETNDWYKFIGLYAQKYDMDRDGQPLHTYLHKIADEEEQKAQNAVAKTDENKDERASKYTKLQNQLTELEKVFVYMIEKTKKYNIPIQRTNIVGYKHKVIKLKENIYSRLDESITSPDEALKNTFTNLRQGIDTFVDTVFKPIVNDELLMENISAAYGEKYVTKENKLAGIASAKDDLDKYKEFFEVLCQLYAVVVLEQEVA